VKNISNYHKVP